MKFKEYNQEYGKNELATSIQETSGKMAALQSLLLGEELKTNDVPGIKEFKCVQQFLDLPMNDRKEVLLKKAFAATIVIAKEKGTLPFELPKQFDDPISIASTVDEALTRLKTSYLAGKGKLDPIEVADALIDRAAIRTMAIADKVIEKEVPVVIDKLCAALVKKCPPAVAVVPIIKKAEDFVTTATKQVVHKGIEIAAKSAKAVVRAAAKTVSKVTNKIKNFLFS